MLKKLLLTFGFSLCILAVNIVSGILTARYLGPVGKGELTAVLLWPTVMASVGILGLGEAAVYFTGKNREDQLAPIVGSLLLAGLVQSLVLSGLGFFLVPFLMRQYPPDVIAITRLNLLFIPLTLLFQYILSIFQGRLKMGAFNIVRFLVSGCYALGILVLALAGWMTVLNAVLIFLGSHLLLLIVGTVWLHRLRWLRLQFSRSSLEEMLNFGLKAHLGNLSSMLNLRMDQMIMAAFLEPALLGLYVVAVTISGGVNLVSYAVASLALPMISAAKEPGLQGALLARFLRFNLWGSALAALAQALLIPWLLPLLFGESYTASIPVARVLTAAALVSGSNSVLASGMKGSGRPLASTCSELWGLGVTLVALSLLLPPLKIMGAAIASLLAYCASFIYLFLTARRSLGFSTLSALLPQAEDLAGIVRLFHLAGARGRETLARFSG